MSTFAHDRLDVYRTAIEFLVLADQVSANLPKGRAYLADQLRRAALSIPLNIAEGAGEFAPAEKARFYRIARRSATECAAIQHACRVLGLVGEEPISKSLALLDRVVAILTAMTLRLKTSGAQAGAEAGAETEEM